MGIMNRFSVLVMLGSVSIATGIARPGSSQADTNTKVIELSAKKYEFSPSEIRVPKGTRVQLKVHSVDEPHGAKLDVYPEGAKDKSTPGLAFDHPEENGRVTKGTD
jgi:plastocyanin